MSKIIPVRVSADGFSPSEIKATQGDTIDLQPSGRKAPPSVSVTAARPSPSQSPDAAALFGIPYPVPGQYTILANGGSFRISAGWNVAVIDVKRRTRDLMEPKPAPNPRK
jgi:hypothetical protein